ncbi:hypothetical protein CEN45_19180 [Fischerella thermalis CCMEE 5198]|jgi:RNA polymerase sigma factor (sigma-70 family)|uniref:sigma-70 family RNA polymerase sigma factor n=1 Tax=Fischerella thermalis TaxID=372787 RepID=UPI000C80D625|nr:sigma-70 family RNA polymerase sigma factor [Fischerella thermalis]PMB19417.1 hypothetical protein CEN45_19180 [Fischerella thermalis CCMEE 5198]PMB51157.1 hypothetical protein CEN39_16720 [Fischerella thermalis CCMEE 5201]
MPENFLNNPPESADFNQQLEQLLNQVRQHPPQSHERQQLVCQIVDVIRRSHRLCRPSNSKFPILQPIVRQISQDLQKQLLSDVGEEIDRYNPERTKVSEWANSLRYSALKKILTDERLKQIALAVKQTPADSNQRKVALNLLVEAIQIANRFCHPHSSLPPGVYEYVYQEAFQTTLAEICQKIDNYNPEHEVMAWVNGLLGWRFQDEIKKHKRQGITQLPANQPYRVINLNEPDTIERFWRKDEALNKLQQLQESLEEDPYNMFTKEHIQDRPDANFQLIALAKIVEGKSWQNISKELQIPVSTVSSFYYRCLKKFRDFFQQYLQQ